MAKQQKKLGEILVEWGFVQPKEVEKALAHAKAKNLRIGEALLDLKLCTENHVYKALAQQSGMEYIDLDKSIDVTGMDEATMNDPTQAPIIKLVQAMIAEAVRNRASDIHIEPMKDRIRVRYRIDGECVERDRIPLRMKGPLISRIKIMAGGDNAPERPPPGGRLKPKIDKANIDFSRSTVRADYGGSGVGCILRPDSVRIG